MFVVPTLFLHAADMDSSADKPTRHRVMIAEYGSAARRLVEFSADGKLTWEHKFPALTVCFRMTGDGKILLADGGVPTGIQLIDKDHKIVFDYRSKCEQILGCDTLPNGNFLIAEQGPCQAVEVDPQGKIVRVTPLTTSHADPHLQVRNAHKLESGNILAAHEGEGAVREVSPEGKVVWEYTGVENAGDAQRLPHGNTLISCGTQKRVLEVTPTGEIAWEFTAADAPDLNLTWISSIQQLKNGNILVGNFLRGQEGKGAHAFEVTRDKKVVWTWADHRQIRSLTTVRALGE